MVGGWDVRWDCRWVHLAEVELALDNVGEAESHAEKARALGLPASLDGALGAFERRSANGVDGDADSTSHEARPNGR